MDIGLIKQGEEENLYNNMLARIANSDLSSRNLSVSVVDALSSLVFLVKNKWKDKVPSTHLTKKQFVHILAYICDRRSTLEEQEDKKIRGIWQPNMLQKEMERNRDALWPGLKFLGVNIGNATGTYYYFFLICSILQQATRVRQRGGMIRWTRYLTEAMTQVHNIQYNILHGGFFWHFVICCICVFVCLCICVFVYFCICAFDTWEYHF